MKKIRSKSRRKTPWSDMPEATALQAFIDESNQNNYHRKHPVISDTGEAELLNSFDVQECRHCQNTAIQRFGFTANGVRRFRCNGCGRTFNVLTNTIFDITTFYQSKPFKATSIKESTYLLKGLDSIPIFKHAFLLSVSRRLQQDPQVSSISSRVLQLRGLQFSQVLRYALNGELPISGIPRPHICLQQEFQLFT